MQICPTHRDQITAALAMRDLNRFNQAPEDRVRHFVEMQKLGQMRIDPFRVAQELILKKGIEVRPDLVFKKGIHCPCCAARETFDKQGFAEDVVPWDNEMIDNAAKMIDEDLKAKGLKT